MWTWRFWKAAIEQAIKAFASALLSLWIVGGVVFNITAVDWSNSLGIAGGAFIVSLLLSIVSLGLGNGDTKGLPDVVSRSTTVNPAVIPTGKSEDSG